MQKEEGGHEQRNVGSLYKWETGNRFPRASRKECRPATPPLYFSETHGRRLVHRPVRYYTDIALNH